jgi:undecaprenyl-diphosphatase
MTLADKPSSFSVRGSGSGRRFILHRRPAHAIRFLLALALLGLSALPVRRHHVGPFESDVFYGINGLPGFIYPVLWAVMQAGNVIAALVAGGVALVFRKVRLAVDLVLAGGGAWLLAKLVKRIVDRGRPPQLLHDVIIRGAPSTGHGYVSGHAATAVALATVAFPYLGKRTRIVVAILAAIVAFARVYVGAHLPLDVVGGAAMGWAIGSLVHLLFGAPQKRRRSDARRLEIGRSGFSA